MKSKSEVCSSFHSSLYYISNNVLIKHHCNTLKIKLYMRIFYEISHLVWIFLKSAWIKLPSAISSGNLFINLLHTSLNSLFSASGMVSRYSLKCEAKKMKYELQRIAVYLPVIKYLTWNSIEGTRSSVIKTRLITN